MIKLKNIDNKIEKKGGWIVTAWQFAKFTVVSLLASAVQFITLNLLYLIPAVKALEVQELHWFVFDYDVGAGGMKTFLAFNIANILAQIAAFFVNRKKTFGSNTNIPLTLTIYMVFTLALICFSAWLAPALTGFLKSRGIGDQLAGNLATIACSAIQFLLYFPVDKLLMQKKKPNPAPSGR